MKRKKKKKNSPGQASEVSSDPPGGPGSGTSSGHGNKGRVLLCQAQAGPSPVLRALVSSGFLLPPPRLEEHLAPPHAEIVSLACLPWGQHCGCSWVLHWLWEIF